MNKTPPTQKCSVKQMLTYATQQEADLDFIHRQCGVNYTVVEIARPEIKHYLRPARSMEEFGFRYKSLRELMADANAAGMSYGKYTEFMRKKFKMQDGEDL